MHQQMMCLNRSYEHSVHHSCVCMLMPFNTAQLWHALRACPITADRVSTGSPKLQRQWGSQRTRL